MKKNTFRQIDTGLVNEIIGINYCQVHVSSEWIPEWKILSVGWCLTLEYVMNDIRLTQPLLDYWFMLHALIVLYKNWIYVLCEKKLFCVSASTPMTAPRSLTRFESFSRTLSEPNQTKYKKTEAIRGDVINHKKHELNKSKKERKLN